LQEHHHRTSTLSNEYDAILFNNIELHPDRAYFIYVGEIKAYGLNAFFIPLFERIYARPVDCIALVPDVLASYPHPNLAVLNQESHRYHRHRGMWVNCRPSPGQLAGEVSGSILAQQLLERILHEQDYVYIHMFESRPEMTLVDGDRIRLLGPDPALAHHLNNKLLQYRMACELGIPVAEGVCCDCLEDALDAAENFFRSGEEIFISQAYSAAGNNSAFASDCKQIQQRFQENDQPYLLTRRIPHSHDPTVLAVVASSDQVYVASVADQRMEKNQYRGSTFPTVLDENVVERLKEYTRRVGRYMGSRGYRGIFGCDYMVDDRGQTYFVEVNARKQGTTLESALTMLHSLPGQANLLEIEFTAIQQGTLPQGLKELDSTRSDFCWGTHNVKCHGHIQVNRRIPRFLSEAEIFHQVSGKKGASACAIVEDHLGPGIYQRTGGFVGRCISVGKTFAGMYNALRKKQQEVVSSTRPWND
jgi:hypothetical protein